MKVNSGVTPRGGSSVYQNTGIPFLRSQNIHFDGLKLEDLVYISEEIDSTMSNSRTKFDDILLNITGASIGRCYFIPKFLLRVNVNQHVCLIRPKQFQIKTKFLYYLLRSNIGQTQIDLNQNGANREGLNYEQIKNFTIPFPLIGEQQKIINFLDEKTNSILDSENYKKNKFIFFKNIVQL